MSSDASGALPAAALLDSEPARPGSWAPVCWFCLPGMLATALYQDCLAPQKSTLCSVCLPRVGVRATTLVPGGCGRAACPATPGEDSSVRVPGSPYGDGFLAGSDSACRKLGPLPLGGLADPYPVVFPRMTDRAALAGCCPHS